MKHTINVYMVEYIMDMIIEQNKKLLAKIAENEALEYASLLKLIPKHSDIIRYISESSDVSTSVPSFVSKSSSESDASTS